MSVLPQVGISPLAADVLTGLTREPKSLPFYLFYDAAGSALFEAITALPEYYLTRTELAILRAHPEEMAQTVGEVRTVLELGAGTAAKTTVLLRALARQAEPLLYIPIDISATALQHAARRLRTLLPAVTVRPSVRDYLEQDLPRADAPRLVLYLGSSIGNFEPPQATRLLRRIARQLGPGGALLLGTDLRKSPSILLPAYDDAQQVTARFNLNLLARLNRELGADFDVDAFRHVAVWNDRESRIEMHLESRREQRVWLPQLDLTAHFRSGERIHTENSYKYTPEAVRNLLAAAGLSLVRTWTDPQGWFAVHLARGE